MCIAATECPQIRERTVLPEEGVEGGKVLGPALFRNLVAVVDRRRIARTAERAKVDRRKPRRSRRPSRQLREGSHQHKHEQIHTQDPDMATASQPNLQTSTGNSPRSICQSSCLMPALLACPQDGAATRKTRY